MNINFLINAAFSAMGLDPETAKMQLIQLQNWVVNSIKAFDTRLRAQEAETRDISRKLDIILSHLGAYEDGHARNELIIRNGTDQYDA